MAQPPEPQRCDHALLYDLDCGFCRWSADRLRALDRHDRLRPVAIQSPEGRRLLSAIPAEHHLESWHIVEPDGTVTSAGAGLAVVARLIPHGGIFAAGFERFPRLTERVYRWIATNRTAISRRLPIPRDVNPRPC